MPLYHDTDKVPILVAYQALSALGRDAVVRGYAQRPTGLGVFGFSLSFNALAELSRSRELLSSLDWRRLGRRRIQP